MQRAVGFYSSPRSLRNQRILISTVGGLAFICCRQ